MQIGGTSLEGWRVIYNCTSKHWLGHLVLRGRATREYGYQSVPQLFSLRSLGSFSFWQFNFIKCFRLTLHLFPATASTNAIFLADYTGRDVGFFNIGLVVVICRCAARVIRRSAIPWKLVSLPIGSWIATALATSDRAFGADFKNQYGHLVDGRQSGAHADPPVATLSQGQGWNTTLLDKMQH